MEWLPGQGVDDLHRELHQLGVGLAAAGGEAIDVAAVHDLVREAKAHEALVQHGCGIAGDEDGRDGSAGRGVQIVIQKLVR